LYSSQKKAARNSQAGTLLRLMRDSEPELQASTSRKPTNLGVVVQFVPYTTLSS
jgi:hypothetical protein